MNTATELVGLVYNLQVENSELRQAIEQIRADLEICKEEYQSLQSHRDYLEELYANLVDKYVVLAREVREIKLKVKRTK